MDSKSVAARSPEGNVESSRVRYSSRFDCGKRVLLFGFAYFVAIHFFFSVWVNYFYAGHYAGPLMISTMFGVSETAQEIGVSPIYKSPIAGWDGQFYYTQSNDPFLDVDYTKSTLIDNASYRFQRNGLPLIAWVTSRITGNTATSPYVYFVTQLLLMSLAFGVLVAYLQQQRIHWAWALVWGLYGGVLRPFLHGLPDPTADAFFLFAILAIGHGRIFVYVIFASMLCLCRESYAAPAAVVWGLTLLGKIEWKLKFPFIARATLVALPGVTVISWAYFVAYRTDSSLLAGSRSIPWGGLVDLPFKAFVQCLWDDILAGNEQEVLYALSCAFCIITVLVAISRFINQRLFAIAALPHVLLMSMTGWVIWEAGVGFFKNTGSVVLLGVLLLPFSSSKTLRAALVFTFIAGLHYVYRVDYRHQQFLPPIAQVVPRESLSAGEIVPTNPGYEVDSQIKYVSMKQQAYSTRSMFEWALRSVSVVTFRVQNDSEIVWPASDSGDDVISIGLKLLYRKTVLQEKRLSLYKDVQPGEWIEFETEIPCSAWFERVFGPSRKALVVGVVHDGHFWFSEKDPEQQLLIEL